MGVYQRGKSWIIDFYYDGRRYTESVGPANRTVAKEKLVIRKREVIQGLYKPKALNTQFDKFKDQYLEYSRANNKKSTHTRKVDAFKHLGKYFTGKRLQDIAPFTIEKYKQERRGSGASPATVNRERGCLCHMFNMAVEWGKAKSNPVIGVKKLTTTLFSRRLRSTGPGPIAWIRDKRQSSENVIAAGSQAHG